MKLLLDTHIILWSTAEPERLPNSIVDTLTSPTSELWFSPISVWEILILAEKKRIRLKGERVKAVRQLFRRIPLKEAPISREIAIKSRLVDMPHQDPADRFIAATTLVHRLTLVTADKRIIDAGSVPVLSAR